MTENAALADKLIERAAEIERQAETHEKELEAYRAAVAVERQKAVELRQAADRLRKET